MRNFIFFHICTINNYKEIVDELMSLIHTSGLYDKTTKIFLSVLGTGNINWWLNDKVTLIYQNDDITQWEIPTLTEMSILSKEKFEDTDKILYIHVKGVQKHQYPNAVRDWRQLMSYFCIEQYETCIDLLDKAYDCCGVNWRTVPEPHYSGNFWWATARYIKTLDPSYLTTGDRYNAEFWLGTGQPRAANLHSTEFNHHITEYGRANYAE